MQQYWRSYMTIRRDLSASFKNAKAVMLWAKMSGDATLASCQMQVAMSLHHKTQRYVRIFFLTSNGLFWILETFCLYPLRSLDASVLVVPIKGIWCWAVFSPSNFLRWHAYLATLLLFDNVQPSYELNASVIRRRMRDFPVSKIPVRGMVLSVLDHWNTR